MSCHWRNRSRKGVWLSQKIKGVPCYVPARKYLCLEVWPGTDWFRTQTASQVRPQQKKDTAAVGIKQSLLMWGQNQKRSKIVLQISLITLNQPKKHWYLGPTLVGNGSLATVISRQPNRLVLWKLRKKVHGHLPNLIGDTPFQRNDDAQGWVKWLNG